MKEETKMVKKIYRVRERKENGRTQIIPLRFETKEKAEQFIEMQNAKGYKLEMASSKKVIY